MRKCPFFKQNDFCEVAQKWQAKDLNQGYLPFTWKNWKFWLENQMVHTILFGKVQKIWAVICGNAISFSRFSLFSKFVYSYFVKVVRKSARDNPKRYCGWFGVHCSSEKFERIGMVGHENVFASANGKQQK